MPVLKKSAVVSSLLFCVATLGSNAVWAADAGEHEVLAARLVAHMLAKGVPIDPKAVETGIGKADGKPYIKMLTTDGGAFLITESASEGEAEKEEAEAKQKAIAPGMLETRRNGKLVLTLLTGVFQNPATPARVVDAFRSFGRERPARGGTSY